MVKEEDNDIDGRVECRRSDLTIKSSKTSYIISRIVAAAGTRDMAAGAREKESKRESTAFGSY